MKIDTFGELIFFLNFKCLLQKWDSTQHSFKKEKQNKTKQLSLLIDN